MFDDHEAVLSPVVALRTPPLGHLSPAVGHDVLIERLLAHVAFTPLHNVAHELEQARPFPRIED